MDRNNQKNKTDDQQNNIIGEEILDEKEVGQEMRSDDEENSSKDSSNRGEAVQNNQNFEELNQKLTLAEESWRRALADYQNLKNRHEREMADILKFAGAEYLKKILPVYDSLEMLVKFNSDQGLSLTVSQFKQILKEVGLEEIEALGKNFDPHVMEAVEMVAGEKDKVIEVIQKGFNFKGKLLRVALVKVGDGN